MKNLILVSLLLPIISFAEIKLFETTEINDPLPIILMADTQIHNLLAPPNFFRNLLFDKLVETAIRPPQLDLFSPDFVKWTLFNYGEGNKVIFLGDALDIGCKNEWERFTSTMGPQKSQGGWIMAFGNHDSFFNGQTAGSRSNERGLSKKWWAKACQEGLKETIPGRIKDRIMAKDDLIRSYLEVLFEQNKINSKDFPITQEKIKCNPPRLAEKRPLEEKVLMTDCQFISEDKSSFLQKVFYSLPQSDDIRFSYKSLMVQEIKLSENLIGFLIDTGDYEDGPTFLIGALNNGKEKRLSKSLNAGIKGNIQKRQIEIIEHWMKGRESNYFFLMGHHPLKNLSEKTQKLLAQLKKNFPNMGFVSAHTHTGYLNTKGPIPEINIGSMTDWNPGFVKLGPIFEKEGLSLEVNRIHFTEHMLGCRSNDDLTGSVFDYTSYKNVKGGGKHFFDFTMDTINRSLTKTLSTLGQQISPRIEKGSDQNENCRITDMECSQKKFLLAKEAMGLDNSFTQNPDYFLERVSFGACQALWASKQEFEFKTKKETLKRSENN